MQLFHPIVVQNRFDHHQHCATPQSSSPERNHKAQSTVRAQPSSSLSNLAKITNVESSINKLAQLRVNKITSPRERSSLRGVPPTHDFSRARKRGGKRGENGKDRAEKRRQSKQKKKKKKRKRRKIRMNTRRIRKCLGDRHNMTFRSSITEEISSSRLLEGGALTIRGKKYPKRYLFSSVNSYVSIECKWI